MGRREALGGACEVTCAANQSMKVGGEGGPCLLIARTVPGLYVAGEQAHTP